MRKQRRLGRLAVCLVTTMIAMTACGTEPYGMGQSSEPALDAGLAEAESQTTVTVQTPNVNAEADSDTPEIRLLCSTGSMSPEEEAAAREFVTDLYRNIELDEYVGECIHMVSNDAWYEVLTVNMIEGTRTYTLQQDDQPLLSIQVGYTLGGEFYSNICYKSDEKMILLKQEGSITQLTRAEIRNNALNGNFQKWQIDSASGEMIRESGIYVMGIPVGEYETAVRKGTGEGDAFDLWTMRDNFAYQTKVTNYDENGQVIKEPEPEPETKPATTQKPAATQKPATTQKPASTQKPAATPEPAPTPEPTPTPDPAPTPPPAPTPDPTPTPPSTPDPPPGPSIGGDGQDTEWTPDLE